MAASSAAQGVNRAVQKLFIGNIPWTVGRRELREYFSQYGHVTFANVLFIVVATVLLRMMGASIFNLKTLKRTRHLVATFITIPTNILLRRFLIPSLCIPLFRRDKVSGMSKGYGFIQYSNREGYSNATGKDSHFLEGGQLIVEQTGGGGGQFDRASGRRGFTNKVDQFDLQNVMNKS